MTFGRKTKPWKKRTKKYQFERGKEMFEQGQISKADLAQLESQAASAQYDCVATQTQIDNYKTAVERTVGNH